MKTIEITISSGNTTETAKIECDRQKPCLTFTMQSGLKKTYSASDLYLCLGMLRADFPDIKFLCKGAKLNVYPSRMCSQMAGGVVAYEMSMGKPAEREDIVNIFDYEDKGITNDIEQQQEFYKRWIESLAH
ncbi:hypothetical protein [Pseudomonas sp. dw_612]|uniref:hypothetical protein n=1 Tax=Pseudomonas sp. dw_612 TaxID=2720080 RepID=UPI001BD34F6E|nr:hypothetical protein [Pseudomonas sp. dw_612]